MRESSTSRISSVCCSMLQRVAVCCSDDEAECVRGRGIEEGSTSKISAVCCSASQCVAVCSGKQKRAPLWGGFG